MAVAVGRERKAIWTTGGLFEAHGDTALNNPAESWFVDGVGGSRGGSNGCPKLKRTLRASRPSDLRGETQGGPFVVDGKVCLCEADHQPSLG
jgi:hypothetical protein